MLSRMFFKIRLVVRRWNFVVALAQERCRLMAKVGIDQYFFVLGERCVGLGIDRCSFVSKVNRFIVIRLINER